MKTCLAIAAFFLLACSAAAQLPDRQPPRELRVPNLVEKETTLIIGRVYPVGWSPDGLFAYVYEPADELRLRFFELIVLDLQSDRIAWQC